MGSRTALSGGFLCGFNIVGPFGLLHEAGQEVGLRRRWASSLLSRGSEPKRPWYSQCPHFFRLRMVLLQSGKIRCF